MCGWGPRGRDAWRASSVTANNVRPKGAIEKSGDLLGPNCLSSSPVPDVVEAFEEAGQLASRDPFGALDELRFRNAAFVDVLLDVIHGDALLDEVGHVLVDHRRM